ncbi:MAG: sensor histidine kinase [Chitinophagales bacterium]
MRSVLVIANLLFLLLCFRSGEAQKFITPAQRFRIDSLKSRVALTRDSEKADCLNQLSFEFVHVDAVAGLHTGPWNPDSSKIFAWQAMTVAGKVGYNNGMGDAWLNLSLLAQEDDYLVAEKYSRSSISSFEKSGDQSRLAEAAEQLGWCLYVLGRYDESRYFEEKALSYFIYTQDKAKMALLYRLVGLNWRIQGFAENAFSCELKDDSISNSEGMVDSKKAFQYSMLMARPFEFASKQEKSLYPNRQAAGEINDQSAPDNIDEKKSEIFARLNQRDSADLHYMLYRQLAPTGNYNIALIYQFQKQYDIALRYFLEYLTIKKRQHDQNQVMFTLDNMATCLLSQKNYTSSLHYARELVNLSLQSGARPLLQNGYKLMWKAYQQQRKPDSAYQFYSAYNTLKDSLRDEEFSRNKLAFELKSREEQQKSRIALLHEENLLKESSIQKEKLFRNIIIGIFLTGLLIATLIFRHSRLSRKREQVQQLMKETRLLYEEKAKEHEVAQLEIEKTLLEMKVLRTQMNPHFIFNSLNSINRFILQNNKAQASQYLTKFSKLVRMILQNSQANLIPLESELESLDLYLDLESLRFNYHFSYKIFIHPELDISAIIVPPLIIQPFVENAIWHGLMHKEEKGQLDIEIWQEGEYLLIKVMDNGIGRKQSQLLASKSATRHKSMGLKIAAERIALMQPDSPAESPILIKDLVDPSGEAAGTEVIIKTIALYD